MKPPLLAEAERKRDSYKEFSDQLIDGARDKIGRLTRECDALRPVVDAARAWRWAMREDVREEVLARAEDKLAGAVDALAAAEQSTPDTHLTADQSPPCGCADAQDDPHTSCNSCLSARRLVTAMLADEAEYWRDLAISYVHSEPGDDTEQAWFELKGAVEHYEGATARLAAKAADSRAGQAGGEVAGG